MNTICSKLTLLHLACASLLLAVSCFLSDRPLSPHLAPMILVLVILALLFLAVARRVTAPVRNLARTALLFPGVAAGALSRRLRHSGDEMAILTRSFHALVAEVRQQRTGLEARIRERTETLTRANQALAREAAEQKLAHNAERESSELFRLVLESAAEAIYSIDLKGNCTFCNTACLRLTGYNDPAELLGRNLYQLLHRSNPNEVFFNGFRGGLSSHADDDLVWRKDGSCFRVEYWSRLLHRNDRVIGLVVTFIDISDGQPAERRGRRYSPPRALGHG